VLFAFSSISIKLCTVLILIFQEESLDHLSNFLLQEFIISPPK
jgi:hypothetical protein